MASITDCPCNCREKAGWCTVESYGIIMGGSFESPMCPMTKEESIRIFNLMTQKYKCTMPDDLSIYKKFAYAITHCTCCNEHQQDRPTYSEIIKFSSNQ